MQDLASIRAFHALCEHKSLTAAAKALNQPKSTLSRRLAQLEEDLGQALISRQGNRLIITKAGKVFARYSQKLLELADECHDAIQGLNNQISGELNIICHPALVRGWLSQILNDFLIDNPKVRIRLASEYNPDNAMNKPDLIIWVGKRDDIDWRCEQLGLWYYAPYASPAYLQKHPDIHHPKHLNHHPWIDFGAYREKGLMMHHPEHGHYFLPPLQSRLESDNIALQIDAIANGHGIGLLPTWTAKGYDTHHPGKIIRCLNNWLTEPVEVNCYSPVGRHPLRLSVLLNLIHTRCPEYWNPLPVA